MEEWNSQLKKLWFFKLLRLPISPVLKSFEYVDFYAKIFLILYPCSWNSITGNAIIQGYVENYANNSYDCIALFLCAHLTAKFREMCLTKGVSAMERYWSKILGVIWPQLQKVVAMNVASVKECDPHKMKSLDLRPHYVIRRYTFFFLNDLFLYLAIDTVY